MSINSYQPSDGTTVIPSMRTASDDHRRAILGKEQLDRLKDSISESIGHIRELGFQG
jgi:hypothetical protein